MQGLAALSFLFAIATMLVGILTSSAHAYLDPGTGSIILQVLLGGVAGLALAGKLYWQKFRLLARHQAQARGASGDPPGPGLTADARILRGGRRGEPSGRAGDRIRHLAGEGRERA